MATTQPVILHAEGIERFASSIKADQDPTDNVPEWSFTTGTDRPTAWVDGSWDGSASGSGTTWKAVALTPRLGFTDSGADVELEAGKPTPWIRITLGDEQVVRQLPKITVKG